MFERKIFLFWVKKPLIKIQKYFQFCHFNAKSPRKGSFTNVHTLVKFLVQLFLGEKFRINTAVE